MEKTFYDQSIEKTSPPKAKKNNEQSKQNNSNNITVIVRVRPLSNKEKYISTYETARCVDSRLIVLHDPQYELNPEDIFRNNRNREKQYTYDYVLDQNSSQLQVFESTAMPMLDEKSRLIRYILNKNI